MFLYSFLSCKSSTNNAFELDVDFPLFKDSIKLTMGVVQNASSIVSNFVNLVKDFQYSNVLSDFAELLDSTEEVLG